MSLHIEKVLKMPCGIEEAATKTLTAAISVSFLGIALMGLLLTWCIIVAVPEDPMVAFTCHPGRRQPDIDTPEVTQTTSAPAALHLRAGEGHRRRRHGGRRGGQPGY